MKFLCVACDGQMMLDRTEGPHADGSLTVVFACPACGQETAMMTNPMETQMVRALDVRLGAGPASGGGSPMSFIRSHLTGAHAETGAAEAGPSHAMASEASPQEAEARCPVDHEMLASLAGVSHTDPGVPAAAQTGNPHSAADAAPDAAPDATPDSAPAPTAGSGGRCPFTGAVAAAFEEQPTGWTPEALERLNRIPAMARSMARRGVEDFARQNGHDRITSEVMDAVRGQLGW